jgi:hypothetical protein
MKEICILFEEAILRRKINEIENISNLLLLFVFNFNYLHTNEFSRIITDDEQNNKKNHQSLVDNETEALNSEYKVVANNNNKNDYNYNENNKNVYDYYNNNNNNKSNDDYNNNNNNNNSNNDYNNKNNNNNNNNNNENNLIVSTDNTDMIESNNNNIIRNNVSFDFFMEAIKSSLELIIVDDVLFWIQFNYSNKLTLFNNFKVLLTFVFFYLKKNNNNHHHSKKKQKMENFIVQVKNKLSFLFFNDLLVDVLH